MRPVMVWLDRYGWIACADPHVLVPAEAPLAGVQVGDDPVLNGDAYLVDLPATEAGCRLHAAPSAIGTSMREPHKAQ
jgi:hypothetical protein